MIKTVYLFASTFIAIILVYLYFLGENKTIEIIKKEYLFILALIPLFISLIYFKLKLKGIKLVDFTKNSTLNFKSTAILFLIFQVVDFYYEGGFLGMISQWFIYWIMGIIAFLVIENVNYYKNYKLFIK